ncbi:hypothetical protein [Methylobacterium sp. E-046]|uniref:hypothetical protein n=1 Tax=Methylobacterium sp. E-046 TaxID=2836576 RepID=UPI001FBA9A93|nr:hypothetical protein [Methylobacterium sp. E-046]MCJ2099192.1 hypothetical protein [Methylobacterium sp. E-046]
MDEKQSIEIAILVLAAVGLIASVFNLLTREKTRKVGYTYSGSGYWDASGGSSQPGTDPSPFGGHSGHDCSHGGFSSDGRSCGGGDGGGGGGGGD